MTDVIERRKNKRFYVPAAALRYKRVGAGEDIFNGSLVRNLSASGARVTVNEFLPADAKLIVELFLPGGGSRYIQSGSRVAWVAKKPFNEQYEAGIKFDGLQLKL